METRDGRAVEIETLSGTNIAGRPVRGTINGQSHSWTAQGRYRRDGISDPRDLIVSEVTLEGMRKTDA